MVSVNVYMFTVLFGVLVDNYGKCKCVYVYCFVFGNFDLYSTILYRLQKTFIPNNAICPVQFILEIVLEKNNAAKLF